jgi:hypothetical protein
MNNVVLIEPQNRETCKLEIGVVRAMAEVTAPRVLINKESFIVGINECEERRTGVRQEREAIRVKNAKDLRRPTYLIIYSLKFLETE